jgi:hypothetical protein
MTCDWSRYRYMRTVIGQRQQQTGKCVIVCKSSWGHLRRLRPQLVLLQVTCVIRSPSLFWNFAVVRYVSMYSVVTYLCWSWLHVTEQAGSSLSKKLVVILFFDTLLYAEDGTMNKVSTGAPQVTQSLCSWQFYVI